MIYKTRTIEIDPTNETLLSVDFGRADAMKFIFDFGSFDTSLAVKSRVFAYRDTDAAYCFGAEFTQAGVEIVSSSESASDSTSTSESESLGSEWLAYFSSVRTSGYSGALRMTVQLVDANGDLINSANILCNVVETNAKTPFEPSPEFRDEVLDALAAAQAAQEAAETAQGLAESAKTAAETAETNAETAETNAETAETNAETAQGLAETAQGLAEAARDSAGEYASAAAESAQTALTAAQPPRVVLSEATASHSLETNKFYDLYLDESALSLYTFTPTYDFDITKLQQIVLHITVGSVAPTIDWGVINFLRDKVPSISAGKAYEVIYEYHLSIGNWVLSYVSFTPHL